MELTKLSSDLFIVQSQTSALNASMTGPQEANSQWCLESYYPSPSYLQQTSALEVETSQQGFETDCLDLNKSNDWQVSR